LHWHAVRTKPRQEELAFAHLTRQHYEVYLPRLPTLRRRRSRTTLVDAPLFPGYLFVAVESGQQAYTPIRSTLGVLDLVRFGDRIPVLSSAVIESLRHREQAVADASARRFTAGDAVTIVEGPFAGLSGVFELSSGADRVRVLLSILGRDVSTTLSQTAVAPEYR
jgi:transcriptional antiterminator RfaH